MKQRLNNIVTLLAVLVLSVTAVAQTNTSVPFSAERIKDDSLLKQAQSALLQAEKVYGLNDKGIWSLAIPHFEQAQEINPNNDTLNFKLGMCYLHSIYKRKALARFEHAYELNPLVNREIHYYLGRGYHLEENWDKAIYEYELFSRNLAGQEGMQKLIEVSKLKDECRNGKEFSTNPERVWVDNLGPEVNSKYAEYSPFITADESAMIFTSRRPNTTGGGVDPEDHRPFEDIYFAAKDSGRWQPAFNLGKPINTEDHDATAGMSPDGQTLFVYQGKRKGGDILQTKMDAGEYGKPEPLGKMINTDYRESSACLSYDGKQLYFVSEKPGGIGGLDIYVTNWDVKKNKWAEPVNIGPVLNTKYDEDAVFMHPDGVTMYFSSKGHNTMGGYDIFFTKLVDGRWTRPKNVGWPINSADDDVFFVVSGSGRHGYYASEKKDGYGEKDLYRITFLGPPKVPLLNTEDNLLASADLSATVAEKVVEPKVNVRSNLALLKGVVLDKETGQPIRAQVELIDNETGEVVSTFFSDSKTGKYLVSLPAGKNYGISISVDNYLFHSENFVIPDSSGYREVTKTIELPKVAIGGSIVLNNIFFDFDKSTLRMESTSELGRLVELMKDYKSMRIEISGHTDSKGSDSYNQKLSESRAKVVVDYLTDKGVKLNRMVFKGYGETMPVGTNDTDEGRQLNRRTEFKILSL